MPKQFQIKKMQIKESLTINQAEDLFKDRYGILALAAVAATLTKTLTVSKIHHYFRFKCTQWINKALVIIKQLCRGNLFMKSNCREGNQYE